MRRCQKLLIQMFDIDIKNIFVVIFQMEIQNKVTDCLKTDEEGFLSFMGKDHLKVIRTHQKEKGLTQLNSIINKMGQNSTKAQKLPQTITSTIRFYGTTQRIYIKTHQNKILGFIKIGEKKLFYRDYGGKIKEISPTSVLDFYVHQSCQRSGIGKEVFEKFLKVQNIRPQKIAYDRPSEKLLSFLKKHYNLVSFIPQNNNFVIFDRFFSKQSQQTFKPFKPFQLTQKPQNLPHKKQPASKNVKKEQEQIQQVNKSLKQLSIQQKIQPTTEPLKISQQTLTSFGCPWAVQSNYQFRTTSNNYGAYYKQKK